MIPGSRMVLRVLCAFSFAVLLAPLRLQATAVWPSSTSQQTRARPERGLQYLAEGLRPADGAGYSCGRR